MQYRQEGNMILLRLDQGEELLSEIRAFCRERQIYGAVFFGIGACSSAVTATYLPDAEIFTDHRAEGMLELVSLTGNICLENGEVREHTHALFSFLDPTGSQQLLAGHLKSAIVSYTAEITLFVTAPIEKIRDSNTGIMVWNLMPED